DLFIWQKKRASAITDALFLQCFYALFGSILFSLKSDPFASDSVSFTDVSSIVLSNLRKFLLAKSLPPSPNAKPNAKASPLNVIINAELTIVLAIPSCVSAINTARTIIADLASPANTFVAGPSSRLNKTFSTIFAAINAPPTTWTAASTNGKYAMIADAIPTQRSNYIKYTA